MNTHKICSDFEKLVLSGAALPEIVVKLRQLKRQGIERDVIRYKLDFMRNETRDDEAKARINEVTEIVAGFCSTENSVW